MYSVFQQYRNISKIKTCHLKTTLGPLGAIKKRRKLKVLYCFRCQKELVHRTSRLIQADERNLFKIDEFELTLLPQTFSKIFIF